MTRKDIVDDVEFELIQAGLANIVTGRIMRLIVNAERDYALKTNCLFDVCTVELDGTTDIIDLQEILDESLEEPIREIIAIHSVSINKESIYITNHNTQGMLPQYYTEYFKDNVIIQSPNIVRLVWTPDENDVIEFQYSYIPTLDENTKPSLTDDITISMSHLAALKSYALWQYMMPLDPDRADRYRKEYDKMVSVGASRTLNDLKMRTK